MTNRLWFWVAAATVSTGAAALLLAGFSWAALVVALQLPLVLGSLLLTRAIVLKLDGKPLALRVGDRELLRGAGAFVAPSLLVVSWILVLESGHVTVQMWRIDSNTKWSSNESGWSAQKPIAAMSPHAVVAHGPEGALGDAFAAALPRDWPVGSGKRLCGDVTLYCEPASTPFVLYQSVGMTCQLEGRLQVRGDADADLVPQQTFTMRFEGSWTAFGLGSRRELHEHIGAAIAKGAHELLDRLSRNAP